MIQPANPGRGPDDLHQKSPNHRRLDHGSPTHRSAAEVPQPQDGYSREFADHPDIFKRIGVTLLRGLLMALFFILFEILNYTIFGIAILQYLAIVLFGRPMDLLRSINEGLSAYMGDIAGYLTCVDDRAPFPFSRLRGARGIPLQPEWRRRKTPDNTDIGAARGPADGVDTGT
ncbi:DUF4389 domain-containing protein [Thiocapsa rosea]|uniref:Uncharacterized protein DUF4389 n=1 Tax=Thiocapsa rosea TaxID=69360 RepID=A0A495V626_9GAMM|nr:DUF4389 domain-containing protein [Thiocapsa rosea]RKT44150.1 uncharacterized protein DUF4389 [Thiocapsa rosea]